MSHIHIVHRSIRLQDNTSLIYQIKETKSDVQIIFIFTPEQIKPSKNKYFSNNSAQFMIESLKELDTEIHNKGGKMLFFYGDYMKVLKSLHKSNPIESVSFNYEYTPYGRKRSKDITDWANTKNIIIYEKEDYMLYDILPGETLKNDGTPYLVYTPYMNHLVNDLKVRPVDTFNKFKLANNKEYSKNKYIIDVKEIDKFYKDNIDINVHGGQSNSLKILKHMDDFKDYDKKRDYFTYKTTFLGATNHFGTVSIRAIYYTMVEKLGKKTGLIRELIWRQFYMELSHHFPHILKGQIKGKNMSLKEKYDNMKWDKNNKLFERWKEATTGFPIVDAANRQLMKTGFCVNRCRMITACFVVKDCMVDWREAERYYASHLVDYDPMVNNNSWQWVVGSGADSQPYFRIFNPWTQSLKYDKEAEYIKKWVPELKDVDAKDIHMWHDPMIREKWYKLGVKYYDPIVDHSVQRDIVLKMYKKALY